MPLLPPPEISEAISALGHHPRGSDVVGRFELGYEAEDLDHAKRLIDAAVNGRVTQRNAVGRSIVTVAHEDGTTESETGITGCASLVAHSRAGVPGGA
jgi:hypothetical protein